MSMYGFRDEGPVLYTIDQSARRLNIGRTAIERLVSDGELKAVRIGRVRRISRTELERFIAHYTDAKTVEDRA